MKHLILTLTLILGMGLASCEKEEIVTVEETCNCQIESFVEKHNSWKIWLTCISEPLALHQGDYMPQVGDCFDK